MKTVSKLFLTGMTAAVMLFTSCDKDDDPGNNNGDNTTPNSTDLNFLTQASYANHNEVALGQLALTKSSNDSIKNLAQTLVTEHTAAQVALDSLGASYNQTLPDSLDSAHAIIRTRLDSLTGFSFDSAFIKQQITDHQAAIDLFQNEINNGNADTIQNYATTYLPKLQMHKQLADSIATDYQ